MMLAKVRQYSAKVKTEDLSNTLTLILSKTAQRQSLSVISNRSTALITNKFSVASLTKPAILNNANIALVDAVHYSIQKLEENYFKVRAQHLKYDALIQHLLLPKPPLKRRKTKAADSRYAKASRERTKKDKDLEDSNTSSDLGKEAQLKKTRDEEELAKAKKEKEEKEAQKRKTYSLDINSKDNLENEEATTAKDLLTDAYILYFKELSSNNSRIFANAIGIGKTQAIVLAVLIEHCDLSDPLALQFCFFSNSLSKNIGRLTKEKAIEMRINTTNAISKALAAANKLVALQSYVLGGRAILLPSYITRNIIANVKHNASEHKSSHKYKELISQEAAVAQRFICLYLDFLSIVQNAKQQCRDILEKEGLNKSEASRRVIFNCFKMQAIASYPALATLKAAQFKTYSSCKVKRFILNSVKDLFTNLSKDYFLVQEARAITKSSLKFQNLLNLCSKVKILGTLSRT
ncbi:hypothetical protein HBH52_119700 [Parastagonospora nodorum]|nr:hypothetical protein HBH52_119700 [Parastagonospora nodorum]